MAAGEPPVDVELTSVPTEFVKEGTDMSAFEVTSCSPLASSKTSRSVPAIRLIRLRDSSSCETTEVLVSGTEDSSESGSMSRATRSETPSCAEIIDICQWPADESNSGVFGLTAGLKRCKGTTGCATAT